MKQQLDDVRAFNRFYAVQLNVFDRYALGTTLTLTEGRIIGEIGRHDDCTANDLCDFLHVDKSYLSRMLQKFEKNGLIERVVDKADQRKKMIKLTAAGQRDFEKLEHLSNEQAAHMLTSLNETQKKKLIDSMHYIQSVLEEKV